MGYNGICEPKNFFAQFLKGDIIQLIILFDKSTKLHLNNRKYQFCQKILKLLHFNLYILYYMTKMYYGTLDNLFANPSSLNN
jgi:hypothetical protein